MKKLNLTNRLIEIEEDFRIGLFGNPDDEYDLGNGELMKAYENLRKVIAELRKEE